MQQKPRDSLKAVEELRLEDAINQACPWSGKPVVKEALTRYRSHVVGFATRDAGTSLIKQFRILKLPSRKKTDHG